MKSVKTAISIRKELFQKAEEVARSMKVSRSQLFSIALEDLIERRANSDILAQINSACADEPDESEKRFRKKVRRVHKKVVEGEW